MKALPCLFPAIALILAACSGDPAPVAPPQATETPTAAPAPPPTAAPAPPPTAAPTASAVASGSPAAKPPKPSAGRPAVMKSDPSEISDTFGSSPASKLELGDKEIATLRLPEGALRQATNITFKLDSRGRTYGQPVGKIYRLTANYPPAGDLIEAESAGDPFVLELPAGPRKDANLAIGVEGDKGKMKWTIVAPKRIDDVRNVAIFELPSLPSAWMHITTKAPGK